ncbi:MAG: hypothetical protein Q8O85_20430 [Rhodoferax sp.]|uniref:hypothetical protein n=1 Tax=Rhodoferax sp. TaxID=50421 RepID=UPI002733F474|nr:hypothetical protein [Rhodoferax sp.]MDP2681063.1 hypothetical protein [Rhodoferax sp.]
MRIVGYKNTGLNQPPATPEEAWQRGRVLDAMLPNPLPVPRGVRRMTHAQRNAQDDARMLVVARILNSPTRSDGTA